MEDGFSRSLAAILTEILKTQAEIRTLSSFLLNDEQKKLYNEKLIKNNRELWIEFAELFPDIFDDAENFKKLLLPDKKE